jgi:multiple sugar transport system ATP-binding protein
MQEHAVATVDFFKASCSYADAVRPAVDQLTLGVADGEFMVVLGPSGCGKTTTLRMLAGLQRLESGSVRIDGEDVADLPPGERGVSMLFQDFAAQPHKAIGDNLRLSLDFAGIPASEARERIRRIAAELDFTDLLSRLPGDLSASELQRVAIGRVMLREPRVYLMDEPMAALDTQARTATRLWLAKAQRRTGVTTVYATHDQAEAMTMGDRIAVMKDGVLQQVDTPRNLYGRPANTFVAGFVGTPAMNLVPARFSNGWLFMGSANVLELPVDPAIAASVTTRSPIVGFRPEHARLTPLGSGIYSVVEKVEDLGHTAYAHCDIGVDGTHRLVIAQCTPGNAPRPGSTVGVMPDTDKLHLFHGTSGERL